MDYGGEGAAGCRPRPPYRCDARIRLRSGFQSRQARPGARRGDGEGLGRRGHEAGLEDDISGKTLRRLGVKTAVVVALAMSCLTGVAIAQQPLPTDRLSQNRAVEAVIWGMPAVNYDLMLQEMLTKTPGKVNQVIYWGKPLDWHNQTLTPNPDTLYFMTFLNTKDTGPIVIEIPPADANGPLNANIVNVWQ